MLNEFERLKWKFNYLLLKFQIYDLFLLTSDQFLETTSHEKTLFKISWSNNLYLFLLANTWKYEDF